ncbi:MAG: UTP--glucose-1-phosphate uridylyltransferase, partial [Candidatus Algichlamydia australiensis]|nr:UTP--glucose-1-phosphate uridylyltransferase [Chlamydiales bacterium]
MHSESLLDYTCCKEDLSTHIQALKKAHSFVEKERYLDSLGIAKDFFPQRFPLSAMESYLLKSLIIAGQGRLLLRDEFALKTLLEDLKEVDSFYADVGGILGYQALVLEQLSEKKESFSYAPPKAVEIAKENAAITIGLANLGEMGEIYPVGGAAERLHLRDQGSGKGLPAAKLHFLNGNLLEGLIRDLEAREFLYFQKYGEQLTTPIALMTSNVKQGHAQILEILEKNGWFGRGEENFKLFCQPLVPAFDEKGTWALDSSGDLALKPGGHGVLWKLMESRGVFDWFASLGRSKALVRQINNPISGTDYGLLSFMGTGFLQEKKFGFVTCPPAPNAKEGRIVVAKTERGNFLSNIEYCAFERYGIFRTSAFPANANILFVDLEYVREVAKRDPFPGMIVNFKNGLARLETTMQNIADTIPIEESYLTLHKRRKTLSATKREYEEGKGLLETPLGALFDYLQNGAELLRDVCGMEIPEFESEEEFVKSGPAFLFQYHPALGPLYCDIAKKIIGGRLERGSELQLEISNLLLENLHLKGNLQIQSQFVTGHVHHNRLCFSDRRAKCIMRHVKIEGSLTVILEENS